MRSNERGMGNPRSRVLSRVRRVRDDASVEVSVSEVEPSRMLVRSLCHHAHRYAEGGGIFNNVKA